MKLLRETIKKMILEQGSSEEELHKIASLLAGNLSMVKHGVYFAESIGFMPPEQFTVLDLPFSSYSVVEMTVYEPLLDAILHHEPAEFSIDGKPSADTYRISFSTQPEY